MKIKKYVFRDHYKVSTDRFRDILGLYFDFKDKKLTEESNPRKRIMISSVFEIGPPVVVNEDQGIYNQNIIFKPSAIPENEDYLNSTFIERFIDDLSVGLVPRRLTLHQQQTEGGGGNSGVDESFRDSYGAGGQGNTTTGSNANAEENPVNSGEQPPDFTVPLEPVEVKTNRQVIYETITGLKRYEDINTICEEVTELKSSSGDSFISADAKYNFHIPKYEEHIQQPAVPEEILPNFYVVSLALNRDILESISQEDFDSKLVLGANSPYENLYKKFDKFITLDGNLSLNQNANVGLFFALALLAYVQQYADAYDSVSVDYVETVRKRFGHIYNNLTNREILDKLNEFKTAYPMYINLEWTTSTLSPLLLFLQNAGISLQALQSFLGDKLVIAIKSTNLAEVQPFTILAQLPRLDLTTGEGQLSEYRQELYTYNAGQWISDFLLEIFSGTSDEIEHNNELFVIDQNEQQIPIGDQFDPLSQGDSIFDILTAIAAVPGYQNLLNTSMRTYSQIIDGDFATSEVLLYKIEKRDSQHRLLQTFYIPNVSGINVQNYVDTQVKFNKEYKYKIFAYTAIYGTEYYYDRYLTQQDTNYFYRAAEGHLSVFSKINLGLENIKELGKFSSKENRKKFISTDVDITFSCFFRVHNADEGHPLIDVLANTSASGVNTFVMGFFGDTGGLQIDDLTIGRWYSLIVVCRKPKNPNLGIKGTRELYLDSKYVGFVNGDPLTSWNDRIFISGYAPSSQIDWDPGFSSGLYGTVQRDISNISIFKRALSKEEIKALVNVGTCGDVREFKKGVPSLNIPDWQGETPAIYWRKRDINKEVTNDGYAGLATLQLHGDAASLNCDSKYVPTAPAEAEAEAPPREVLQPRPIEDSFPPLFDIPPFSESPPEIFRIPPKEPEEPFKTSVYDGVAGYGEIAIPMVDYGDKVSVCECPPGNSKTLPQEGETTLPNQTENPPKQEENPSKGESKYFPPSLEIPTIPDPIIIPDGKYEQPIGVVSNPPAKSEAKRYVQPINVVSTPPTIQEKQPTVTTIKTTTPPRVSIPKPKVITKPRVTKEQIAPQGETTTTGRPISVGGETPPLPPPKKTIFRRKIPTPTLPENRVSELPAPTTPTKGPITPIEKPIIIPKSKRKPLVKGEKK